MARTATGSDTSFFVDRRGIEAYLLQAISENTQKKVGTETELFYLSKDARTPVTISDGQKIFRAFASAYESMGFLAKPRADNFSGGNFITDIEIPQHGTISLETFHGYEFATDVCNKPSETQERNALFREIAQQVGDQTGYQPVYRGFVPEYSSAVAVPRERNILLRECMRDRFGEKADYLCKRIGSFASFQVNVDGCGKDFHEAYRTLLIAEPAIAMHYNDQSGRLPLRHRAYFPLQPEQTEPVTAVWNARDNEWAVAAIVDRLLKVRIPFLPDPENPGIIRKQPLDAQRRPPSVGDMLAEGRLSERLLKHALSFMYMSPSLRRPAVLEVRGIDTQPTAARSGEVTEGITNLVYRDDVRKGVLEAYAHFDERDVAALHHSTVTRRPDLARVIKGQRVGDIVADIVQRSSVPQPRTGPASLRKLLDTPEGPLLGASFVKS
jgi:gamma-glutamylcysteine synthetase